MLCAKALCSIVRKRHCCWQASSPRMGCRMSAAAGSQSPFCPCCHPAGVYLVKAIHYMASPGASPCPHLLHCPDRDLPHQGNARKKPAEQQHCSSVFHAACSAVCVGASCQSLTSLLTARAFLPIVFQKEEKKNRFEVHGLQPSLARCLLPYFLGELWSCTCCHHWTLTWS